jgi:hypothetical protein
MAGLWDDCIFSQYRAMIFVDILGGTAKSGWGSNMLGTGPIDLKWGL